MNIFDCRDFTVMIDYAHNPHGIRAVGKFIQSVGACPKLGIIAGTGDRRDEDLISLGKEASKIFDEVIVRMDDNTRGRTYDEIFALVSSGIKQVDAAKRILLIPDEAEAVRIALTTAKPGSFVVVLTDRIDEAIEITKEFLQNEHNKEKPESKQSPVHRFSFLKKVAI